MPSLVGQTLMYRYRVDEFIARGGMADVYKVWDANRATFLAMKLLRDELVMDTIFVRRFRHEARALASLQHPHIVRFYGIEENDTRVFILLDYIDGTTLQQEIRQAKSPLPVRRALEICRPVCSALHYAHGLGIMHCDIKSANIMIHKNGNVLAADFGPARLTEGTTSAALLSGGTAPYMAPEQIRGELPTPQTDIYSLGVVLFEMLTGDERPFTGEAADANDSLRNRILWEHLNAHSPSPRQ